MSASFEPGPVDHITVGTVGRPGQRVFFLQVRTAGQTVSFKLEKGQVAALSVAFSQLLSDLPPTGPLPTDLELVEPVEPTWVIGAIGLSPYDDRTERLTLMAEEAVPDGEPDGHTARFELTRAQMAALAQRGRELVEAGRPPCPLCGQPIDPSGHACPRSNGHRAH